MDERNEGKLASFSRKFENFLQDTFGMSVLGQTRQDLARKAGLPLDSTMSEIAQNRDIS